MPRLRLLLASTLALCLTGPAGAASVPYAMTMSLGNDAFTLAELESAGLVGFTPFDGGGDYSTLAPITQTGDWQLDSWTSRYENLPAQGAFLGNNLEVTNLSAETQIFRVAVLSPAAFAFDFDDILGGLQITLKSMGTEPDATLTSALGAAVFTSFIDGSLVRTLANDPFSLTCAGVDCSITRDLGFGVPVGPRPSESIGITIQFALSPGDSALLTSGFSAHELPEPATLVLVGGGLAGLAFLRRRRGLGWSAGAAQAPRSRRRSARRRNRPT